MKFMSVKYLMLTIFIILIGCRKDNPTIAELIVGKWDWVKSMSGWSELVISPQTVGYSLSVEFNGNSVMKEYKNDTLILSTTYTIDPGLPEPNRSILNYNSGVQCEIYFISDTLILNSSFLDGPISFYVRNK
jgi:hypothetical protein